FGWTPCVGPILGSILLLASTSTTALQGAFLLTIFSAGLAIPFLLIAAGIGSSSRYIQSISPYLSVISVIGGIFLIILGVLLVTEKIGVLISHSYGLFRFINYDRLLDYL
ncbi:cytochrome c biogenesis protein CcdA, partial [Patescibacteria group bacterium]|nr:cytochrome c biogenesis protein CcdA [Patescibacteria group bacterium]